MGKKLSLAGLFLFVLIMTIAVGAERRPEGACPAWVDEDSSGYCDKSEKKKTPCRAKRCPANIHNTKNSKRTSRNEDACENENVCFLVKKKQFKGNCHFCVGCGLCKI